MTLVREDIDHIERLVKKLVTDMTRANSFSDRNEIELRERTIRVEEELKHQRELMLEGFKQMEKRFEQVDKRFEQAQQEMNKRFEQVDKRFDQQHQEIMGLHNEIKVLMRWGFGALLTLAGLVVTLFRMTQHL